jgi:hypothetical protein
VYQSTNQLLLFGGCLPTRIRLPNRLLVRNPLLEEEAVDATARRRKKNVKSIDGDGIAAREVAAF